MRRPVGESPLIGWHLKSSEKYAGVCIWGRVFQAEEQEGDSLLGLSQRENDEDREVVGTRSGRELASPCKDWLSLQERYKTLVGFEQRST